MSEEKEKAIGNNPMGKNEPLLREMYLSKTEKEPLTKEGKQSKAYLDWKLKGFKVMKPTLLKNFGVCVPDILDKKIPASECFEDAYNKTIKAGSVYISPALRIKQKAEKFQKEFDIEKLEAEFKKKHGID